MRLHSVLEYSSTSTVFCFIECVYVCVGTVRTYVRTFVRTELCRMRVRLCVHALKTFLRALLAHVSTQISAVSVLIAAGYSRVRVRLLGVPKASESRRLFFFVKHKHNIDATI